MPLDPFAFARTWLGHYRGACIGSKGLELIVTALSRTILSRGYVTTRVLLPVQDLSSGTLTLALVPGVIRQLDFAGAETRGSWKSAFRRAPAICSRWAISNKVLSR